MSITDNLIVKGKRVVSDEVAWEFATTLRGQYIISQALSIAIKVLDEYEKNKDWTNAEPSNCEDMKFLLHAFPLYKIHESELPQHNHYQKEQHEKENENGI
tara:strand:+ start:1271 stop:1573 length:303 start_codon:yes stop_codon:yes gene_type:complete